MTSANNLWQLWLAAASAFCLTLAVTPLVRRFALLAGYVDKPAGDRWGQRVVPRLGGVGLFVAVVTATLALLRLDRVLIGVLVACSLVFVLGVVDDLHRLRPYTKLFWQLAVGCVLVMWGIRIELVRWPWLSIPLSIFWFVLVMNAFNLLDNMDGLAAGVGAIAAAFCAFHAALAGQWTVAMMAAIIGGACLGFLRYNFPPAKIYMGDSGSHLLGLSLSAVALLGTWHRSTQLISIMAVPALVLAVPIFDTCFVTLQRLTHRQHPFQGGRDHVSHRLAILGLSARQTVLVLYAVSGILGGISLWSIRLSPLGTAVVWLLTLTTVILLGTYLAKVKVYELARGSEIPPGQARAPVTWLDTMLLHKRRLVEILVDFFLIASAYVGAYLLRFEANLTPYLQALILQSLPVVLVIKLACFAGCGLYRGVWRYLGLSDLFAMVKAVALGSLVSLISLLYIWRFQGYSRAVFIIDGMLLLLAVGASRVVERVLDRWIGTMTEHGAPVLIIGAGDTGAQVLRHLKFEARTARRVIGFLDDDAGKLGARIHGCRVLGSRTRLAELLEEHEIREVLVAISDPPGELLEYVRQCCELREVLWKVVTTGVRDTL